MVYAADGLTITAFWVLVGAGMCGAIWWARKHAAPDTSRPSLAHGLALGTQGISGALLLGTCGLIAFYGYDGLLYAIGFLAGWFAAVLGVAGPLSRMSTSGTLAETLRLRGRSPGAARAAAVAGIVVCLVLLSAEFIAAGALLRPMLGSQTSAATGSGLWAAAGGGLALLLAWFWNGGLRVRGSRETSGFVTAAVLLLVCGALASALLQRSLKPAPADSVPRILSTAEFRAQLRAGDEILPNTGPWADVYFARVRHADGALTYWRYYGMQRLELAWDAGVFVECQVVSQRLMDAPLLDGTPAGSAHDLSAAGYLARLPEGVPSVQAGGPLEYLATVQESSLGVPREETVVDVAGRQRIFYPDEMSGEGLLSPGQKPGLWAGFSRLRGGANLVSLMLALFCGGAVMAGIVPRAVRSGPSAAVGIGVVGVVFLLLLVIGLGALVSGRLDPGDSNRTLTLAAGALGTAGPWMQLLVGLAGLAVIAGTIRRLLRAIGLALWEFAMPAGRATEALLATLAAVALVGGVLAREMNAAFVVGWALNIAAAAFLPTVLLLLFRRTVSGRGIALSIWVGLVGSGLWILLSADALEFLFGWGSRAAAQRTLVPWNQPAVVMVPVALLVLAVGRWRRN